MYMMLMTVAVQHLISKCKQLDANSGPSHLYYAPPPCGKAHLLQQSALVNKNNVIV